MVPIQRVTSSLSNVNCGPGYIQCIYSYSFSGFNIQLRVSALILDMCRQFDAPYTANIVSKTPHILQITLCELWSRPYTMYLQLHILRLQYSAERISAVIGDISTIQCALYSKHDAKYSAHSSVSLSELWSRTYTIYLQLHILRVQYSTKRSCAAIGDVSTMQCALHCKLCAKYSAQPPDFVVWTVVPDIYNIFTAPIYRIQYSTKRSCAAIGDIPTVQCALHCTLCAKYSAQLPDFAMWTVVQAIYNVTTAPYIQASIFNKT
jgi:hypothetical protein